MKLVILDLETTGLHPERHGICSIGAKLSITGAEFYIECRVRDDAEVDPEALAVNGFTIDQVRDAKKVDEHYAVNELLRFIGDEPCMVAGLNPGRFDHAFIAANCARQCRAHSLGHRTLDLHSLAIAHALATGAEIPPRGFNTDAIYALLGMSAEPRPHHALVGARMEFEAFSKLLCRP